MNLSPDWVKRLNDDGFEAIHWSTIGSHNAPDSEITEWARDNSYIILTHDLDFGILLAHCKASAPSVVQVRTQDVTPNNLGPTVILALRTFSDALEGGALLTIDQLKSRIRILPI